MIKIGINIVPFIEKTTILIVGFMILNLIVFLVSPRTERIMLKKEYKLLQFILREILICFILLLISTIFYPDVVELQSPPVASFTWYIAALTVMTIFWIINTTQLEFKPYKRIRNFIQGQSQNVKLVLFAVTSGTVILSLLHIMLQLFNHGLFLIREELLKDGTNISIKSIDILIEALKHDNSTIMLVASSLLFYIFVRLLFHSCYLLSSRHFYYRKINAEVTLTNGDVFKNISLIQPTYNNRLMLSNSTSEYQSTKVIFVPKDSVKLIAIEITYYLWGQQFEINNDTKVIEFSAGSQK